MDPGRLDGEDAAGSPATYGRPLATFLARQSLFAAEQPRFRTAIERADAWLTEPRRRDRHRCLGEPAGLRCRPVAGGRRATRAESRPARRGQSDDGGWGPASPRLPSRSTPPSPCWAW